MKNVILKSILFARDLSITEVARQADIPRTYLSFAVGGRWNLTEDEKNRVAKVLSLPVEKIFPQDGGGLTEMPGWNPELEGGAVNEGRG